MGSWIETTRTDRFSPAPWRSRWRTWKLASRCLSLSLIPPSNLPGGPNPPNPRSESKRVCVSSGTAPWSAARLLRDLFTALLPEGPDEEDDAPEQADWPHVEVVVRQKYGSQSILPQISPPPRSFARLRTTDDGTTRIRLFRQVLRAPDPSLPIDLLIPPLPAGGPIPRITDDRTCVLEPSCGSRARSRSGAARGPRRPGAGRRPPARRCRRSGPLHRAVLDETAVRGGCSAATRPRGPGSSRPPPNSNHRKVSER